MSATAELGFRDWSTWAVLINGALLALYFACLAYRGKLNLHTALLDGVIQVDAEDAREHARRSARQAGLLVGVSSGATLAAIAKKLPELPKGARVLGFNYDTGERYLSIEGFLPTE